eukprot:CAMPEP_0170320584 /NCGR_PEP_ID=MMETSP0116_2-20130129/61031_1 /TAXON_ID=400756 /ORGANISM="Durinskia baltica, Strain CSIRO CS-38" /LENGTH=712 /DNA_ID=CAMNT_0010573365 /DNA_START=43 /DNA_END=2179 /DNA_ORIENTATION=+
MARQLQEIVERLNSEPFRLGLSLVSFDEKDPYELMEVLRIVLTFFDAKHDIDPREEKTDAMYQRIAEFLHILGYQCSFDIEFQEGLISGDKHVVHPILYWILSNLEPLKKRSYLAKFCMNLEVPEEFLRDEKVYEVFQQYKELQSQFKATHSHLEKERQGRMNPAELQKEVQQLDSEREQLSQKIQSLRMKTAKDEAFAALLEVTSRLRKEQEEEARLGEKLAEQRHALEQVEQLYLERSAKLRELREAHASNEEGSAEVMLRMLRSDVQKGREQLERVHRETDVKMGRLRELDEALNEPPVQPSDIDAVEGDIGALSREVQSLEEKINEHNQDSRLTVYKQQANLVAKRKEAVIKEQRQLEEDRDVLSKDLSGREREYEQLKGHKFMARDELKNYAASLREKSQMFKKLKAELSELRHEVAILVHTEDVLKSRDPTPHGLKEAEQALEKASVEKSRIDKAKGKTLDEISGFVQQINTKLKEKKNKLAPQIKALRAVRQNFQQVEVRYLEKKGTYEQAKSSLDGDVAKIAGEVKQLENDVSESEQKYYQLHIQLGMCESKLARASREARCMRNEESHSTQYQTLAEEYKSQIEQLDEQVKELRKEQKVVKESHEGNLQQKQAFSQLEALMRIKLKVAKQEMQGMNYTGMPTRTMLDASQMGVERLVTMGEAAALILAIPVCFGPDPAPSHRSPSCASPDMAAGTARCVVEFN